MSMNNFLHNTNPWKLLLQGHFFHVSQLLKSFAVVVDLSFDIAYRKFYADKYGNMFPKGSNKYLRSIILKNFSRLLLLCH